MQLPSFPLSDYFMKFIKINHKMENIRVQTSQNVAIEYSLANVGERLISNIFDYLIIGGYYLIIFIFTSIAGINWSMAFSVVIGLLPFLYQLLCEVFLQGQSFGMRIRKTKVIRLDGKNLSIGNCLLRWALRPIDILISGGGIAVIAISMSKSGQRIGDMAAGTTVVKMKDELVLDDTIFHDTGLNYKPIYPQVNKLSDADIAIIKETIHLAERTGNRMTAFATCKKLESILFVKNLTPAEPVRFLRTIIKDYNHITGIVG
jgi:uncharacterized RDD family membrane protein YckC